jgi:hypothetical protein
MDNSAGSSNNSFDPETLKVKEVAYIEVERRIPVAVQVGTRVTTYKVQAIDPPVPLQIPPAVQAAFDNQTQQMQAAVRRIVPP